MGMHEYRGVEVRASRPIEGKVTAGALGAGVAAPFTGLVLWILETYVLHDAVPAPLELFVLAVVPAIVAWIAAYAAPHTPRPDLEVPEPIGPSPIAELLTAATPAPPVVNFYAHPPPAEPPPGSGDGVAIDRDTGEAVAFKYDGKTYPVVPVEDAAEVPWQGDAIADDPLARGLLTWERRAE